MPPGLPNKHFRNFVANKALTQEEIEIVRKWALEEALEGDTTLAPKPPVYKKPTTTLVNPDLTFRSNYVLPDSISGHLRRCFRVPLGQHTGKNIQAIEVVPVYPYIVHSVFIYADNSVAPIFLDDADTGMGYSYFYGTGSTTSKPLYGWTLGSEPFHMPQNLRLRVESSEYLIIQVQYAKEGVSQMDSSLIHINFDTSSNIRSATTAPLLNHDVNLVNGPFELAIDSTKVFHERYNVFNPMSILSISPTAHAYCDNMNVYAVLPNKDTVSLLKIDNWDASWSEGNYFYRKPVHLPKGSAIHAFSLYSNTASNLHEGDDTLEPLHAGLDDHAHVDQMVFNFTYLPYSPGDENIVFDTLKHRLHFQACKPVHNVSSINSVIAGRFRLFPNPATETITIHSKEIYDSYEVTLYNVMGQTCLEKTIFAQQEAMLDVSGLKTGVYFVQIVYAHYSEVRRIIVSD